MKPSIIIWGIGERTQTYLKYDFFQNCEIKGYVDSVKPEKEFQGKKVWKPKDLQVLMEETDYLVIANYYVGEIFAQCLDLGIDRKKIIFTDRIEEPFVFYDKDKILDLEPKLKRELALNKYRLIQMNEKDEVDEKRQVGKGKFAHIAYMRDYFRYRTFEFMAELLEENKISGQLAELGVFRGEFSALINKKFPEKKLYLFDTFEGFVQQEIEYEMEKGRCDERFADFHTNTSVEQMVGNLPNPKSAIICKGLFPDSISEDAKKELFAFVSIDVDFEQSIYAGLEFFYPRLTEGGVIFLHDYNSAFLGGVKIAVKKYEEDMNVKLKKVPIADRAGTLVIVK